MSSNGNFLVKVVVLSTLLSVLIKVGGPYLPIETPFTESLNSLAIVIVVLPSIVIGIGLLVLLKRSPS